MGGQGAGLTFDAMKPNIALVTGGYSGEATISYRSANTIYNHLDKDRYEVYRIDVNPQGWYWEWNGQKGEVNKNDFSITVDSKKIIFDAVFIGMHGTPGEDGKLQGYFDMLRLPYTSCNAATSALSFNKRYTTAVAAAAGIPVAPSVHLFKGNTYDNDVVKHLQMPLFVKPNNGGSSIGMSKIVKTDELQAALDKAFREDDQVLVEQMISGREFTVGVYQDAAGIHVLPITEVISENFFFDFEAKYEGKSREITPAEIGANWKKALEETASKIYQVFNCNGVVRIDFIYNEEAGKPYMLEINTIPGQSDASVIPQQVRAAGGNLRDFYAALVDAALAQSKKS